MITFEKIRWKNFLSTGDHFTELNITKSKSTLIVGENGSGKSTLTDALAFALYGKAFRKINRPQLLNSINNKHLEVEVEFSIGNKHYEIKRGIKPTKFEIWVNGTLLNQDAASRDYQRYLEENILKMNFKSFAQIVVLGSTSFIPFMSLPASNRRAVVEDLLDINIFTTMNNILKEKQSNNKDALNDAKYQLGLLNERLIAANQHNESLKQMKDDAVKKIKEKMRDKISLIESTEDIKKELDSKRDKLLTSIYDQEATEDAVEDLKKSLGDTQREIRSINKEMKFFSDHAECPTCTQDIDEKLRDDTIDKLKTRLNVLHQDEKNYNDSIDNLNEKLDRFRTIGKEITHLDREMYSKDTEIRNAKQMLHSLNDDLKDAQTTKQTVDTQTITNSITKENDKQNRLLEDKDTLSIVGSMLKDGGIKTRIIKQYVPVINKLINKYLASMDFFIEFELDENFDETIKSRFRDVFSYGSFSEGEKLRIDLALLFTWRSVAKLRNSVSTNLLIMDEIMDSSLDDNGTEEFLKILQDLTDDSNSYIISHKGDQLYDKFDHIIRFEKHKSFSRIVE